MMDPTSLGSHWLISSNASKQSLKSAATPSMPLAVALQLLLKVEPPQTEQAASMSVVLPVEESPTKWKPPPSEFVRLSIGPANAAERANIRRGLPIAIAAISDLQSSKDPACVCSSWPRSPD